jgi:tellurite resistance protein
LPISDRANKVAREYKGHEAGMTATLNPHSALIYVMVVVSAADARMSDAELHAIGDSVRLLPAFRGFRDDKIIPVARECAAILQEREGLEAVIGLVKESLTPSLRETAYALALDVALAESPVLPEENRVLQRLRTGLEVDRLTAAALEKAAIVRHARIPV